jgi:uncharacterized membrane protein required for colicin V production
MPILILAFFIFVVLGFIDHRGGFFFGMLMGGLAVALFAFFAMKQVPKTISKCLIKV